MGKHSSRMILKGATPEKLARAMARTAIKRREKAQREKREERGGRGRTATEIKKK